MNEATRAPIAGGTDARSGLVGFGRAADLLSRKRVASKQTVAAVRGPLTRPATAPPLSWWARRRAARTA